MYPKVLLETCSSRRHLHQALNCPSEKTIFPLTAKWAAPATANSIASYLHVPRTEIISHLSNGDPERGNVYSHRASCRHTNWGRKKIISSQLFLCTKPCFSRSSPVHRSFTSQQLLLPTSLGSWGESKALTGVLPCEGSDAESSSRGRRFLLGWGTALLSQLFVRGGGHQLPDEYSLQAAIINALSQPSPTGKPATQPAQAQVSPTGRLPPSQSWRDRQLAPINTAHGHRILCSQKLVTNQSSAGSIACTTDHP